MPTSERDEILLKYATLQKESWSWADFASAVTTGLGIDAGLAAGAGMLGVGTGIAGLLFTTPGWFALASGVAIAIYNVATTTYNDLSVLLDRIDALDPNDLVKDVVEDWRTKITEFQTLLKEPNTSGDKKTIAVNSARKLENLTKTLEGLALMQKDWEGKVKPNLTDSGFDPWQFKSALDNTIATLMKGKAAIKAASIKANRDYVAQMKEKGNDYVQTAKQVLDKWNKVSKLHGNITTDNDQEKAGLELANKLTDGTASPTDISKNLPNLNMLNMILDKALSIKTSSVKPPISKRALTLGDGRRVTLQGVIEKGKPGSEDYGAKKPKTKKRSVSASVTKEIQRKINHLAAKHLPEASFIKEDGIYGPQTGGMLAALMGASREIREAIRNVGVSAKNAEASHKIIRRDPKRLSAINNALSGFVGGSATLTQSKKPQSREDEPDFDRTYNEENPSPSVIDYYLRRMMVDYDGRRMSALQFLTHIMGFRSVESRAKAIREVFERRPGKLTSPSRWINQGSHLVEVMKRRYPEGRGRFSLF
jgi:hypothetical protein